VVRDFRVWSCDSDSNSIVSSRISCYEAARCCSVIPDGQIKRVAGITFGSLPGYLNIYIHV